MRPTDPDALPQAFAAAVNRADLDAALALWTDDAVFVAADGTASQGRQAVRAILSALIESGTKIMIAPERIYVAGETAVRRRPAHVRRSREQLLHRCLHTRRR